MLAGDDDAGFPQAIAHSSASDLRGLPVSDHRCHPTRKELLERRSDRRKGSAIDDHDLGLSRILQQVPHRLAAGMRCDRSRMRGQAGQDPPHDLGMVGGEGSHPQLEQLDIHDWIVRHGEDSHEDIAGLHLIQGGLHLIGREGPASLAIRHVKVQLDLRDAGEVGSAQSRQVLLEGLVAGRGGYPQQG